MEFKSTSTGNILERRAEMFYFRGRSFSGLVDVESNALYDDPEDSFAMATGLESSLSKGLIAEFKQLESKESKNGRLEKAAGNK